jgi:hypothetical protein
MLPPPLCMSKGHGRGGLVAVVAVMVRPKALGSSESLTI